MSFWSGQSTKFFSLSLGCIFCVGALQAYAQNDFDPIAPKADAEVSYGQNITIYNPKLAKQNWILECQGCHRADATGKVGEIPDMNGYVSKLLSVPGGQEYLSRVNGISESPLSDAELVDLMNWMLVEFDPENIPNTFSGFLVEEVSRLRKNPLGHTILEQRAELEAQILKADKNLK